jgi:hypothetical protein
MKNYIGWLKDKLIKIDVKNGKIHFGYVDSVETLTNQKLLPVSSNWDPNNETLDNYIEKYKNNCIETTVYHHIELYEYDNSIKYWLINKLSITNNELLKIEILPDVDRIMFKLEHDL